MRSYIPYKAKAIELRREGKTYTEIQEMIEPKIPQSTLSDWFNHTLFSPDEKERIALGAKARIKNGHLKSMAIQKAKREIYFQEIQTRLAPLAQLLENQDVAKVALLMLYWCEGTKVMTGSVRFGNSDPSMIRLFVALMRKVYDLDESKFRCTIQCRADQNVKELAVYWSQISNIPLFPSSNFIKLR